MVQAALTRLRRVLGSRVPPPVDYRISRWNRDPFSRGAYSAYGVGSDPQTRLELGRPLNGVVFFAGEATHPEYPSTVHGALLSGYRAALEILQS